MATATGQLGSRKMREVLAPKMFQFTRVNEQVRGKLIDIDQVEVKGKPTLQYLIREDSGDRITFLATYDLQRKISPECVGHYVVITYEGEDNSVQTQGSPLRKFKVMVSEEKESN